MKKIFMIVPLVVILDQATKYLANNYISPFKSIELLPVLHLVNIRNTGTAFGLFRSLGNNVFIIISIAAIVFISALLIKDRENSAALSLVLGGAIGNLIDRVLRGSVVDFVDFFIGRFHWPAFNVADSALTIGIGLIFIRLFIGKSERNSKYKVQN